MDFSFSEDQNELRRAARRFLEVESGLSPTSARAMASGPEAGATPWRASDPGPRSASPKAEAKPKARRAWRFWRCAPHRSWPNR